MKKSKRQTLVTLKEQENKELNTARKGFWLEIQNVFNCARDLLALRKDEKEGIYTNNEELDMNLAQGYIKLCDAMMPVVGPFAMEVVRNQMLQEEMDKVPKNERVLN